MAIRSITDATGKRIVESLLSLSGADKETAAKFPHPDYFDIFKMCIFAQQHGHYATTLLDNTKALETMSSVSPLLAFLNGMSTLSNFENSESGRVAFITEQFNQLLLFETTRQQTHILVKTRDGMVTRVGTCPVKVMGSEHFPAFAAFLLLSSDVVEGLNTLEDQGKLDDEEALMAMLNENQDGLYFHGNQAWLKHLDIDVSFVAGNKMRIKLNELKKNPQEKFYMLCADVAFNLPDVTWGNPTDITSSNHPWYGAVDIEGCRDAVPVGENEYEFDVTKFIMPTESESFYYAGISKSCPAGTTYEALTLARIVHCQRNMKPYGYIDVPMHLIP